MTAFQEFRLWIIAGCVSLLAAIWTDWPVAAYLVALVLRVLVIYLRLR